MKKCVIIRSSDLETDTRVPKLLDVFSGKYKLLFLGWNRNGFVGNSNTGSGLCEQHLFNMRAPLGKRVLLFLPFWWLYVFIWLIRNEWDIVHVINFNSAIPAIFVAKIKSKKVVYEILETYEDSMILPRCVRNFIIWFDKIFISISDAIVLADIEQIQEFNGIPNRNVIVIYDSPPDYSQHKINGTPNSGIMQIFYAGVLFKSRRLNVDKMIDAVAEIKNVKLVIAGYGDLVDDIIEFERKMPEKIQFIGKLDYKDALEMYSMSDLGFVLREPLLPINKYICGSTLLNIMMCGKPLIVNGGTSTAKKVLDANCGIVVDAGNIDEIKEAVILLRDNCELRAKMGRNARVAYEKNYHYDHMDERLLSMYASIFDREYIG